MIGWAIVCLICLGYFISEARRAPIMEDIAADNAEDAPTDWVVDERRCQLPVARRNPACR